MRGNGVEIGRHWNDGVNLGARARFENAASAGSASSVLWVDDLREADRGAYRCRVDFRQAPTRNARINLEVIGERMGGQFLKSCLLNDVRKKISDPPVTITFSQPLSTII